MAGSVRSLQCPVPTLTHRQVLLGHGSGGRLMHDLIEAVFRPRLLPADLTCLNDAAYFHVGDFRLAITTDSFVVDPIFFPGGDIGRLAVHGTVNDLAVSGARPLVLSAAFILEEGFPIEDLERVVDSMREASAQVGVPILTGDTKVVQRGKCDRVFINTTGVGVLMTRRVLSADQARPGDLILLNGDIAAHGIAILAARGELELDTPIVSDTAPLHTFVEALLEGDPEVRCMRDLTRGGLASALHEIAQSSGVGIRIWEDRIPVRDEVRGVCEVLGLDPLHVANEGKLIAIVAREDAEAVLTRMRAHPLGREAAIIGEVVEDTRSMVLMKTQVGGFRVVDMLAGEQLPRIC
ncbi:MAG: hydrogenase expression/formation protein HypE [Acidobacteria bacterium]|nr:hydrogenase expression/formation protein HypE [Acidobacteriota bacterium]